MILLVGIACIATTALLVKLSPIARRRVVEHRLRRDWWTDFERDLRSYERSLADRRHHSGDLRRTRGELLGD